MPPEEELDEQDRRLLADVAEHGWHAVQVTDDEPSPFTYSIGVMHTLGHPELVMFGLDVGLMHEVLWNTYRAIASGRSFATPCLYEGIIRGYAVATRPVHPSWHSRYLGYAMWHRRYLGRIGTLEAVQIVWPDKAGRFPWDTGAHPSLVARQPRLDLRRDDAADE